MKRIAQINPSTGEVVGISTVQSAFDIETGSIVDGSLYLELDSSLSDLDFMATQYWKDDSWNTRPIIPGPHYEWKDYAWVQNLEEFWAGIRYMRNNLLASCDWTQLPDCGLSEEVKEAWQDYRTNLRNVPSDNAGVSDEADIDWPPKPVF